MHAVKVNSLKRTDLMIGSDYGCCNAKLFTGDTLDTQSVLSKCTENSKKKKEAYVCKGQQYLVKRVGTPQEKNRTCIFHFSCFSTFTPEETR